MREDQVGGEGNEGLVGGGENCSETESKKEREESKAKIMKEIQKEENGGMVAQQEERKVEVKEFGENGETKRDES